MYMKQMVHLAYDFDVLVYIKSAQKLQAFIPNGLNIFPFLYIYI